MRTLLPRWSLLLAALLVPAAAPAKPRKAAPPAQPAAATTPAPARAATAQDPPPAPKAPLPPIAGQWRAGGFLALDIPAYSGGELGPRAGATLLYGLGEIGTALQVEIGPRLAFTCDRRPAGGSDFALWTVDALATARFSSPVSPRVRLYGDVGAGLGYANGTTVAFGVTQTDNGLYLALLFAPGFAWSLTPTLDLTGEVGFWMNARTGLGLHAAVPTLGLQWRL